MDQQCRTYCYQSILLLFVLFALQIPQPEIFAPNNMTSETTDYPLNRQQMMELEDSYCDALVKLNDMSLESINPDNIQMREINFSNHRNSNQSISQQMANEKRHSVKDSKSNRENSKIDEQRLSLGDSKKTDSLIQKKFPDLSNSANDKQHECLCANSDIESCEHCFCLLNPQPCVYGLCCLQCFVHKNQITHEFAKDRLEDSQKKKRSNNFVDVDTFFTDRESTTLPIKIEQQEQEKDIFNERLQKDTTGKKYEEEKVELKSPEKKKLIRKASDSQDSVNSKDKNRQRKQIFPKEKPKKQPKIDEQGNKPYPILPQATSPANSPTKSSRKKGLVVTLNPSSPTQIPTQSPQKIKPNQNQQTQTLTSDYKCNCNSKKCKTLYCKCVRLGQNCSEKCGCSPDCENGYESVKRSGHKVYLENSGSGISPNQMMFVPPNFDTSQAKSVSSSKKSIGSVQNMKKSQKKCCSCSLNSKCSQKTCQCFFVGKHGCGPECKCSSSSCRNRRQAPDLEMKD